MAKMDALLAELENLGAIGETKVEAPVAPAPVAKSAAPAAPVRRLVAEETDEDAGEDVQNEDLTEDAVLAAFSADYRLDKAAPIEEEIEDEEIADEEVAEEVAENEIDVEDVIERLRAVETEVKSLIRILRGG